MSAADALWVSAIRRSGHACPGKLKRLLSHPASGVGCEISDQRIRTCLTGQNFGCEISGRRNRDRLRVQGVVPPDDTERASLSRATPSGFPKRKCGALPYLEQLHLDSGFAYGKGLQSFGSSCFWAFHCFAIDSKELSSISDCFGDQKAIKTPKLNTIWLELIAMVLNILIGLKGDNYYSKVFKRVNYKLWNSTFWVVITRQ